jgi:hypothetical protein
VIPQDPVIITGSVAFNLDPQSQHSREEIQSVANLISLEKTLFAMRGVSPSDSDSDGGDGVDDTKASPEKQSLLDYELVDAGSNLSQVTLILPFLSLFFPFTVVFHPSIHIYIHIHIHISFPFPYRVRSSSFASEGLYCANPILS